MVFLSSFYPQPVVAGTTEGTYAEGNDPRFGDGLEEAPEDGIIYGRKDAEWVDMTSPANLQVRRGTAAEVAAITPLEGEPVWATDLKRLYVGDGTTTGGVPVGPLPNTVSGKTIYVDVGVGTNTRTGLSRYDITKPFATIAAAVAASVTGDLVYVRAGTYTIISQINLNLKGNMFFEAGTTVIISQSVVAFSYSESSAPISILGYANFVLNGTGVLTMPSGNATTTVLFECNSISGPNSVTGTLFNCAIGVLSVDAKLIQMTTDFAGSNATVFNITGSGKVTARVPFVYCGVFLNGQGNITGGAAQFNTDTWTLVTYNPNAGMTMSNMGTNFRIVNYNHVGGVVFNWTNDLFESHFFNGVRWVSLAGHPSMSFASNAETTTRKIISLKESNVFMGSLTNSLSSAVPINVWVTNSYADVAASASVTFKVGSFTVDPLVRYL